jgi:carbamoyl-phosphate synthase large subunit
MPKREDVESVLLIGSGPIVIGQAAEFDFSGSQACRALKEEGVKVVLVNSNPATIMTDPEMADKVYIEPLTPEIVERVIEQERPDGIIAGLGGQTGLNISSALADMGVLEKYGVELLGTPLKAIRQAEDRQLFKNMLESIGEPVPRSRAVYCVDEAIEFADDIGLPLIIRPAYTLGGFGGGIARTLEELKDIVEKGLKRSMIHQVLVEESVLGWKEIEYEVMRDGKDTCITICNMENMDPMGIHTGDSIVITPSQTLTDEEHQMLRDASLRIIRALRIEGGCNIQFAIKEGRYVVVEVNPRVSRSSALASKATGYPIARVSAKIAIGLHLDEIVNDVTKQTPASFEPTIDYVVVKIPRWPFDKFKQADRTLTTSMKSTGEVMAIGRTLEEAFMKAVRCLEIGKELGWWDESLDIEHHLKVPTDIRLFAIYHALERGMGVEEVAQLTDIDPFFIRKIDNIRRMSEELKNSKFPPSKELLLRAKRMGFTDEHIAGLLGVSREEITDLRLSYGIKATYKMVDTCAAEFEAATPYYYSTYESECETRPSKKRKVLIIGSGPIRIGQGIEFDYCTVHAVSALKEEGFETLIINNNPETVSTDYDTSDKLFFEPITLEDVMNVIETEKPEGVLVQFGGQTSVNLAVPLERELERRRLPTKVMGTSPDSIDIAEDRKRFNMLLTELGIPQPRAGIATSREEAKEVAKKIGYPVLVRPSYVLGGRAMEIVYDDNELERYITEATAVSPNHPILIDEFLEGAIEIDVDAVCDGRDVFIGAVMEHIEEAGIHSGDSACVIPPQSLPQSVVDKAKEYVRSIALALGVKGLINIQMAYKDGVVYVLEANPRSSRTIPYVSKATGIPLAKIAAKAIMGKSLSEMGYTEEEPPKCISVKEVVLPFNKLPGADPILGPEMRSTGEVMGVDYDFGLAFYKAELAAGNPITLNGTAFISVNDADKPKILEVVEALTSVGLSIIATKGTAKFLRENGFQTDEINKVSEGHPNVVDLIKEGKIQLVINTPTSKMAVRDGYEIRRAAVDYDIPYITTIQAAQAAATAIIAVKSGKLSVEPITKYHG